MDVEDAADEAVTPAQDLADALDQADWDDRRGMGVVTGSSEALVALVESMWDSGRESLTWMSVIVHGYVVLAARPIERDV